MRKISVTVFIVFAVCLIFISGRSTMVLAKPMASVEASPNVGKKFYFIRWEKI